MVTEIEASNNYRTLIIIHSYHHSNTLKIALVMSEILGAEVIHASNVNINEIEQYDIIGFGSGIDSGHHYQPLLDLAIKLKKTENKKSFIFSTSSSLGKDKVWNDHRQLRDLINAKGYNVIDEFSCKGLNTNGFLKFIGGINRGRPNKVDLEKARQFTIKMMKKAVNL